MNCAQASKLMHEYFDGDLAHEHAAELKAHLDGCPECRERFNGYERTEAFLHMALAAPVLDAADRAALTDRIMGSIPGRRRKRISGWFRQYPGLAVAAMLGIVLLASFIVSWEQNTELVVRGNDLSQIVIEGNRVVVPEGATVDGDLVVENGEAVVNGEIRGNLTVIDGSVNMASTAKVIGEAREINQALDWIWYKLRSTVIDLAS
jgi:anti-sigma factor RsiW